MKKLLYVLIPFILSGCGESEQVKKVKSFVYDAIDSSITVGNALDNRPICKSTDWKAFKGDRNRDIVEYRCHLKLEEPNHYLASLFESSIIDMQNRQVDIITTENFNANHYSIFQTEKNKKITWGIRSEKVNPTYQKYHEIGADSYLEAVYDLVRYKQLDSVIHQYQYKKVISAAYEQWQALIKDYETLKININQDDSISTDLMNDFKSERYNQLYQRSNYYPVPYINDDSDIKQFEISYLLPIEKTVKLHLDKSDSSFGEDEKNMQAALDNYKNLRKSILDNNQEALKLEQAGENNTQMIFDIYNKLIMEPENQLHYNRYLYKPSSVNDIEERLQYKLKNNKSKSVNKTEEKALELLDIHKKLNQQLKRNAVLHSTLINRINQSMRPIIEHYETLRTHTNNSEIYPLLFNVHELNIIYLMSDNKKNHSQNDERETIINLIDLTDKEKKDLVLKSKKMREAWLQSFANTFIIDKAEFNQYLMGQRTLYFDKKINNQTMKKDIKLLLDAISDSANTFAKIRQVLNSQTKNKLFYSNAEMINVFEKMLISSYKNDNVQSVVDYDEFIKRKKENDETALKNAYDTLIKPYNDSLKNTINDALQYKQARLKVFEQKIQWSVIENKAPTLIACQLMIEYTSVPEIITTVNPNDCFNAAYSSQYLPSTYNKAVSEIYKNFWDSVYD